MLLLEAAAAAVKFHVASVNFDRATEVDVVKPNAFLFVLVLLQGLSLFTRRRWYLGVRPVEVSLGHREILVRCGPEAYASKLAALKQ